MKHLDLRSGFVTVDREHIYTAHLPVGGWVQMAHSPVKTLRTVSSAAHLLVLLL
ncbi:hypothetical protein [Deinococcus ruber]|uniref:hypothetical protein n=1 Tax=Deinococcus ruber TaxID=1848197 RepID=UPI00166638EB|nr:hypothetical protein [Deinococcus ruber]